MAPLTFIVVWLGLSFSPSSVFAAHFKFEAALANSLNSTEGDATCQQVHKSYDHLLVVPELKLAFCFIPKNACTQFNRLFNDLNGKKVGMGNICQGGGSPYKKSMYERFGIKDPEALMKDSSWTKAVFLRDPLERLVSAFQSKCETQECGLKNCLDPKFDKTVDLLSKTKNPHYGSQDGFCGGLSRNMHHYDFVGELTDDYAKVHGQVMSMFEKASQRSSKASLHRNQVMANMSQAIHKAFCPESMETHSSKSGSVNIDKHFPDGGPQCQDYHNHLGTDYPKYYSETTLKRATSAYSVDYQCLPKLSKPSWVNDVRA